MWLLHLNLKDIFWECVPLRKIDGTTIEVQHTTITWQSIIITKGSKCLLTDGPPLGENVNKKRKKKFEQ